MAPWYSYAYAEHLVAINSTWHLPFLSSELNARLSALRELSLSFIALADQDVVRRRRRREKSSKSPLLGIAFWLLTTYLLNAG